MTSTLLYFKKRGRGNLIRLTATILDYPLTDKYVTIKELRESMETDETPMAPYGSVPVLGLESGLQIAQGSAIIMYMAEVTSLGEEGSPVTPEYKATQLSLVLVRHYLPHAFSQPLN